MPFRANQQMDRQNNYRIDAHWLEESSPKNLDIYLE